MNQDELFHEDWRDALTHLVKALGGYETVGADLYPNKTRKAAGNWLFDCLSDDRPAKLDLDDIEALLRMGRKAGCHTALYILCDRTDYVRPEPSAPKSKKTLLLEQQAALAAALARNQRDLDRMECAAELKAVRT